MEELSKQCKKFIIVSIYKKGDKTDNTNNQSMPLLHKTVPNIIFQELTSMYTKLLEIINAGVNNIAQLLIIFFAFVRYCRNFIIQL